MNVSLLRVLRTVILTDSDPARQALFTNLVNSHPFVRVVCRFHGLIRGTWASALLISGYGLGSFLAVGPPSNRRARVFAFARHTNARQRVTRVADWIGHDNWAMVPLGRKAALHPSGLVALGLALRSRRVVRALRLVRFIDRRQGFLVTCRSAGALGWYARSRRILDAHRPGAVLVSSDAQPEEMGFVAAARAAGIPQVFISHAYPTPLSPPLDFTLSILEGEAELHARARKGPIRGQVLLAGIEGESAPMDAHRIEHPSPVIGVFPPKAVAWPVFRAVIADCRDHLHAKRVVVRWHPSMIEPAPHLTMAGVAPDFMVESPRSMALEDVARQCDWVIADENSHVHLPVLKLGIPTVTVRLGVYPKTRTDQYGFIAAKVVMAPLDSLRQLVTSDVLAFLSDDWASRFARYDAAYRRAGTNMGTMVRQAIWRLFEAS